MVQMSKYPINFNRFWLIHRCDRRTDGQTAGRTMHT